MRLVKSRNTTPIDNNDDTCPKIYLFDWELGLGFTIIVASLTEKFVTTFTDNVISLANNDGDLLMPIDDIHDDDNSTSLTDDGVTLLTWIENKMKEF